MRCILSIRNDELTYICYHLTHLQWYYFLIYFFYQFFIPFYLHVFLKIDLSLASLVVCMYLQAL